MAPPTEIDGHTLTHLLKVAREVTLKKTKDSVLLDEQAERRIPKFEESELNIGHVLGRGGFCVVQEIKKIVLKECDPSSSGKQEGKLDDEHHIHNIVQDREFMQTHCIRQGKDCRYALKRVQDSSMKDSQTFVNAVVDLAVEARFLSVIRHPNIIKMRAMEHGSPYNVSFFLVLDRLYDILGVRLSKWKKQKPKGLGKMMDRGGKKELAFWVERCTVCYDLACALKYLHDLHIIYRDIKPDNIGFDVRGDVKIFDFGLAKEFDSARASANGTYKLTGDTGSPRYMAPEVALEQPYNETVDVYSFCILMWQILRLETPFEGYTLSMFRKKVVEGGSRPAMDPKWPAAISDILKSGWGKLASRPSMDDVSLVLRDDINRNSDTAIDEILDASRKSAMSMHNERK